MQLSDFDYRLPPELIAQVPAARRDASRLLVVRKDSLCHLHFPDLRGLLCAALVTAGLRERVRVIVGGAPASESWAQEIGADGYSEDAIGAVALARRLLGNEAVASA